MSMLGKTLKTSLRYFTVKEIMLDVNRVIMHLRTHSAEIGEIFPGHPYRIKSLDSCLRKFKKYSQLEGFAVNKTFNDLLGFRVTISSYSDIPSLSGKFSCVDLTKGKSVDDGYRGYHIYYSPDNNHYPVEV